jgi:hypothetical protein
LALTCALAASAQGPSPRNNEVAGQAAAAPATAAVLHGHIADPTGALIPGATVTVLNASGKVVATTKADAEGAYQVRGLAPGSYTIRAEFAGFAVFQSPAIAVAEGQSKRVDVTMAIQMEQQNVVVTEDNPTVNTEANGNANAIVLKGKDLDALSDDPDELANELQALAGPSAGPNGGQIFIDGFSGGQLPPKSAIREIRINQNPFSAEYDKLGYGRIEILTKPGTDKLHGQVFMMGNDNAFNTGNPFSKTIPSYYSYMFNGTVSGPINKNASFFASAERRHIGNINTWLIPEAVLQNPDGSFSDVGAYGVSTPNIRLRTNASIRFDLQLGKSDTFTVRYGYWNEGETGDLNAGTLPSGSWHESNSDHTVQMSDAHVINDHIVNETRFQYERHDENHYPDSAARTISVPGDFTGGGLNAQLYRDHNTSLEFQNLTTWSHGAHAINFGTRLRDNLLADYSTQNYNGTFRFTDPTAYLYMANGLASGQSYASLVAANPSDAPITASYTAGPASATASIFDAALWAQDDWKVNQRFTLSGGMRFEAQNHISDHNDWAPRVGMAYALDGGHGKQAKTVLRAGFGTFYDRFAARSLLTVHHLDEQNKIVLNNPECTSTANSLDTIDMSTCSSSGNSFSGQSSPVRYRVASSFHSPYTSQFGTSIERQLTKTTNATVTYLHSFGVHQLVTTNANQFNPETGAYPLDPTGGYIYQYTPEAVFKQNQVIASVNARLTKNLSVVGFYTLGFADSNGGAGSNASNAYNLSQDYGPATFVSRNQIFSMANYNGPWGLRFNPFLIANSGKPFNITIPSDPLNDFYNQRPTYATASTPTADQVNTPWGVMDTAALPGEQLIPANLGVGPAGVAVNLRVSRGFGFGPETGGTNGQGGGFHGGGGGHGHGGPPGGSLGPGGLGGGPGAMRGMFGGGANRKYSLTFSAQALNLFNDVDYGGPNGTIGSKDFLRSTTLAGGIFSSGSAVRRVFVQAIFSF